MGTGGVAVFGLQIAKLIGARPIVLSAHDWKQNRAKEMGAEAAIDYSQVADWDKEVVELTGEGVDVTLETVGATTLERSMKATRAGGSIALVGRLDRSSDQTRPFRLAMKNQSLYGIYVGSATMLREVIEAFAQSKTKPVVDRVFGWEEAIEAYRHLASQSHFGKVVIRVSN
jgi:NADPH:quinone reductase-like Zn-dependent oxidoreductase